jgi:hypothetical protein
MIQLPLISSSLLMPTNSGPTVTTTKLIAATHLIPTFPSTYVFNAVTPSFVYDSNLLARPVFSAEVPVFGYTLNSKANNEEKSSQGLETIEKTETTNINSTSQSNNNNDNISNNNSNDCCCCCCCCNKSESSEKISKKTSAETIETTASHHAIEAEKNNEINEKKEVKENLNDFISTRSYDHNVSLRLNELNLEEKIKLIRKELNLPSKEEQLNNNPICYCKPSKPTDMITTLCGSDKEPLINSNEKTKYTVNYMPVHRENCEICSYNDSNRSKATTPISRFSSARKSRSKSPKHWLPTGKNEYSSKRLHFNDYSSDITKVQHLGSINGVAASSKPVATETIKPIERIYYVEKPTTKYYTVTTKVPAKTIIRTTINSNSYHPSYKYKETLHSVNCNNNSINMTKWTAEQN